MKTTKKKCARPGCKVRFMLDTKNPIKRYCSPACGSLCRPKEIRLQAARTKRERQDKKKAEAKRLGMTPEQLFEARLEAYWQKVVDPFYYTMQRGGSPQSSLGGLDG